MVFLDESGHFNSTDYMCMAGFISTDQGWSDLCAGWRLLLRQKYKIPVIHMREIVSEKGKSPAAAWDLDRKVDSLPVIDPSVVRVRCWSSPATAKMTAARRVSSRNRQIQALSY
jgi:hypothetical protein